MKITKAILIITAMLVITACGSSFEWFPTVTDTTAPIVTAQIAGITIFDNRTTHVPASEFPANVNFSADEPATIYYTTNNDQPTTASPSVNSGATGPLISISGTILRFFGVDAALNSSTIQTSTIKSP